MLNLIHWEVDLFIRAQHFQAAQRALLAALRDERNVALPYGYGVIEWELNESALQEARVEFRRLRVVMPESGHEVWIGEGGNADLGVRNLREALRTPGLRRFSLQLCVPRFDPNYPMTVSSREREERERGGPETRGALYSTREQTVTDENTGDDAQPLAFRRIRARLLLSEELPEHRASRPSRPVESLDHHETFEILRLERGAEVVSGQGQQASSVLRMDPDFVPAMLSVSGIPRIVDQLDAVVTGARVRRDSLMANLKGTTYETLTNQHRHLPRRLQTLAQVVAELRPWLDAANEGQTVHPFQLHLRLLSLHDQLVAFHLGKVPFPDRGYIHDDPYPVMGELFRDIIQLIQEEQRAEPKIIDMTGVSPRFQAQLKPEVVDQVQAWYLRVEGLDTPLDELSRKWVENPDQFRVLPGSKIDGKNMVPGIKLRHAQILPNSLFGDSGKGAHFFELRIADYASIWRQIQNEGVIGLWISAAQQLQDRIPGLRVKLYGVLRDNRDELAELDQPGPAGGPADPPVNPQAYPPRPGPAPYPGPRPSPPPSGRR